MINEKIFIGFKDPLTKFLTGTLVYADDDIRPSREILLLNAAGNETQARKAIGELNAHPARDASGISAFRNSRELGKALLEQQPPALSQMGCDFIAYIYSPACHVFLKHVIHPDKMIWDNGKLDIDKFWTDEDICLNNNPGLKNSVCEYATQLTIERNGIFSLMLAEKENFSLYSTQHPEWLYRFAEIITRISFGYKPQEGGDKSLNFDWEQEDNARKLLEKKNLSIQEDLQADLPGFTAIPLLLEALQTETDSRIRKNFPDYNPLEQRDQAEIMLDVFTAFNTLWKTSKTAAEKSTVLLSDIENLADQAEIRFNGIKIDNTASQAQSRTRNI